MISYHTLQLHMYSLCKTQLLLVFLLLSVIAMMIINDPWIIEQLSQIWINGEVNSTWLITSELANQCAQKALFTCVVNTKCICNVINNCNCLICHVNIVLYVSMTNMIAPATLISEHILFWLFLYFFSLFYFMHSLSI